MIRAATRLSCLALMAAAMMTAPAARAETADVLPDMSTIGASASPFDLRDGDKARYLGKGVLKAVEAFAASQKGQPPVETPVAK